MQNIAFVDLKTQYRRLKSKIDARMADVLEHGQFIMGPEVPEFEKALAKFANVQSVIGVASGTDALQIALMAEGIGPGDAVFVPSFTFTATAEVIIICGAEPVFCDVDSRNFNLDHISLQEKIDAVETEGRLRPGAIIAVDLFGLPADYAALTQIAVRHDMTVIADAAQSFGAQLEDKNVGGLAPITATSFFPAKPLGCFGDGGALLTNDEGRAEVFRSIRAHGKGKAKYDIARIGLNSRLDTLQAAVLLVKLSVFEEELASRQRLADRYTATITDVVVTPTQDNRSQSSWAQYAILLDDRDATMEALKGKGVPTAIYYPKPMHLQSAYTRYGSGPGSLPVSEDLSARILCLPMHPYMPDSTADYICDSVRAAVGYAR
jgi:UDP-2-acetamido-2-deoxy-ribo-hexuluronate aminotransferase